jgi:hypothetical protein
MATANEMADDIESRVDRASSYSSPGYEDFELTQVLTEAEEQYVKQFISKLNNRKGHGFEETEIRAQGLSALLINADLTASATQTGVLANGVFYDLPSTFMYSVHEDITIDKTHCVTSASIIADVRTVAHKEISRWRINKYKKPYYNEYEARVWRLVYSRVDDGHDTTTLSRSEKRHQIVTDGTFTVSAYNMTYMQKPKGIIVDRSAGGTTDRNCILDDSTHDIIVDIAAGLLMERVKEQGVQNVIPKQELE